MASGVGRGPAGGGREPLTEELLARLLASATPQEYLDQTQVGERAGILEASMKEESCS